jgi:hypothetical protein
MKRLCHSKEIGILLLLFCSAEPQKDLVIRIDSLLFRVHIEQTTEMFLFFFPFFLLFGWVLVGIIIKAMQCTGSTQFRHSIKIDFNWMLPFMLLRLKSFIPHEFSFRVVTKIFEKCQEFSYGPKVTFFVFCVEFKEYFSFVTFN